MSMPTSFATKVGLFSMRRRMVRTILSLIPCVLLIAVMFVGSTIPNGLVNELDNKVLKNAENSQELVQLDSFLFSQPSTSSPIDAGSSGMSVNKDLFNKATQAPQVEEVYPQFGQIDGIVEKVGNITNGNVTMRGTSKEYAKMFSPEEFVYEEGKPIPMLVNQSSIYAQSFNWSGADTLDIDMGNMADMTEKQKFAQLKDADTLVGTTIKVSFRTFPGIPEAYQEMTGGSAFGAPKSKVTKISAGDKEILNKRLQEIYGSYWDLAKLREPIDVEFKIVGVIQNQSYSASSSIPNEAVPYIWNRIYQRQKSARTSKALSVEMLASESQKLVIADGILPVENSMSMAQPSLMKEANVSVWEVDISSFTVPGLVVESTKNAKGQNEYKETSLSAVTVANFEVSGAIVRLKTADDREPYIKYLNDSGIYMMDQSPLAVIRGVRKWSNIIVTWMTIILGAIVALILLTTVSRFVADSRKEIGVWRAIGATRFDIIKLILVRMSLLLGFGVVVGIAIGFGLSYLLAGSITNSVNAVAVDYNPYAIGGGGSGFISAIIISMMGGEVPTLELRHLLGTNWGLLLSRLGLLAAITLVIGLIPALRAARISPVTAIRDSE